MYFAASIDVYGREVTNIDWKQIYPFVNHRGVSITSSSFTNYYFLDDLTNSFNTDTGYANTSVPYQKLKMSTFNYYRASQVYKV